MYKYLKKNNDYYLFSFFLVSIIGYFSEMIYSLLFRDKFVLPGVLYGPWCPIYGITFVLLLILINKRDKKIHNIFKIFIIAVLIEYLASFISDKFFHRIIWNYSKYLFNINGRVCMHMSILFTLSGYLVLYYIEPIIKKIYNFLGKEISIINISLLLLFIFDLFLKVSSNLV